MSGTQKGADTMRVRAWKASIGTVTVPAPSAEKVWDVSNTSTVAASECPQLGSTLPARRLRNAAAAESAPATVRSWARRYASDRSSAGKLPPRAVPLSTP